jgi:hypothetical protein
MSPASDLPEVVDLNTKNSCGLVFALSCPTGIIGPDHTYWSEVK